MREMQIIDNVSLSNASAMNRRDDVCVWAMPGHKSAFVGIRARLNRSVLLYPLERSHPGGAAA